MTAEQLAQALEGKREGREWVCACPVHQGHSFKLRDADGKIVFHCHAGCEQEEILEELRGRGLWPAKNGDQAAPLQLSSARAERALPPPETAPTAIWRYVDAAGQLIAEKGRFDEPKGKRYAWRRAGDPAWKGLGGQAQSELPLYRSNDLREYPDDPVWFVEGEKCADAITKEGFLGVSAPGGASQEEFGESLEALRGRKIILWPDNDRPGRAFMRRLARLLKPLTAKLQYVEPIGGHGDDAADWLAAGHPLTDLEIRDVDTGPRVERTPEGYQVRLPAEVKDLEAEIRFEVDVLEVSRDRLETFTTTSLQAPGIVAEPIGFHLNLYSMSNVESYRRNLDGHYGKVNWTTHLNTLVRVIREQVLRDDPARYVEEMAPVSALTYLIHPILPADDASVMYADGATGKTYVSLYIALILAYGNSFLTHRPLDRPVRTLVVDYETNEKTFRWRMQRLAEGMRASLPERQIAYWPGQGVRINASIPAIRRRVERDRIDLVIVDSALLAVGGEIVKPGAVGEYFAALQTLGCTTLTIAHVSSANRSEDVEARGGAEGPIGSVFWRNAPRRAWLLRLLETSTPQTRDLALVCKKASDGANPEPVGLRLSFTGDEGPVSVAPLELDETNAPLKSLSLHDRIAKHLESQPLHDFRTRDVALDLGINEGVARTTLARLVQQARASVENGLYRYRAS